MPAVSGRVVFDRDRSATINAGDAGIINVPIILQNTGSNVGAIVLTDATGNFQFNNVPTGSYRLVEAWGSNGGSATPLDFSIFATTIAAATPVDPPISQVLLTTTVPTGATGLSSLSPNTLLFSVAATTIANQDFLDGPFRDVPLNFQNTVDLGPNLINTGGQGIFGTIPNGTAINAYPTPNPYPGIAPAFTYIAGLPAGASTYTFVNIFTQFQPNWWNTTDHTTGMETGRFMLINGGAAGQTFFVDTVPVAQNTQYIFSTWMINVIKVAGVGLPMLGIEIRTIGGSLLYSAPLIIIPEDITLLTWRQVGTVFNSGANSSVVVRFISQSSAPGGNDYAIDDVNLQGVSFNQLLTMSKDVDKFNVVLNETLTYTLVIKNSYTTDAVNLRITDTLPTGTSFVSGTVKVNGVTLPSANPISFTIPNVVGGATSTVTFQAIANTTPSPNPMPNTAYLNYDFYAVPLQVTVPQSYTSNTVNTYLDLVALRTNKNANSSYVNVGDTYTYTIGLELAGGITITNVRFIDTIPNGTIFVPNSFQLNGITIPSADPSPPSGVDIGTIPATSVLTTLTFQVTVVTKPNPNPIQNVSYTTFNYTTIPSNPNGARGNSPSNMVNNPTYMYVDLQSIKSADFSYIPSNRNMTYTVLLKNNGTADARNITFKDTIPTGTTYIAGSFAVNGVTLPTADPSPPLGVNIGTIPAHSQSIVTFKVFVPTIANGTQIANFSSSDFVYSINPTGPNSLTGGSNSNIAVAEATTLPIQPSIPNNASYTFNYTVDPSLPDVTGGGNTNTAYNFLNTAKLEMVKESISYTDVGTTLTYTITMVNTGTTTANNVIFSDTIPAGTTFVNGSFSINGTTIAGSPNPPGINIGMVGISTIKTITFDVIVNTIPSPNPIQNSATALFLYTVDPSILNGGSGSSNSNIKNTKVNNARVSLTKTNTPNYADIGSTVTYTIVVNTSGNTSAANVIISDTIPNGTEFVDGSFSVNGTTIAGSPIPPGVNIGTIPIGITTVSFKVTVNTIPTPNPLLNSATATFNYTVDPSVPNGGSGSSNSNINNNVKVNNARVAMTKLNDINYADIGSTVTYTIVVNNSGNTSAANVIFSDTIPSGTDFVNGSLSVNGTTIAGSPTPPGVNIGTIPVGITTVSFKVTVNTIPTPNPIQNSATTTFNYTVDPSVPNGGSGSGNSNINNKVQVNHARVAMTKLNDMNYADIGSTVTYTIVVNNSGNTSATNVIFSDTIPSGTDFVSGSFSVNGTTIAGSPTPPGVNIGTIPVGITTVSFKVTVNTIPTPNPIQNSATTTFNYTVDPSVPNGGSGSGNSNINNVTVNNARVEMTKLNNIDYADIGSTVTYTIVVNNSGNTSATNVIFSDTIPNGTDFVSGSLSVNGVTIAGSPTPPGVNIGTIPIGITTVSFKVTVNTIPTPNPLLNSATAAFNYTVDPSVPNGGSGSGNSNINNKVQVNNARVAMTKLNDINYADIGSTVTYTIVVNNSGNTSATNVIFSDTIPNGTDFVNGSLSVNGTTIAGSPTPPGVNIGTIPVGITTVSFKVNVNTIPTPNPLLNSATAAFNYTVDPSVPNGGSGSGNSNINNKVQVNHARVELTKLNDMNYADIGSTVTYTIVVNNSGNTSATNVIFSDTIPSGTDFVNGSLSVNGTTITGSPTPPGVNIGTIPVGITTVSFKVTVNTIPTPNPILNSATAAFNYTVDPSVPNGGSGSGNSDINNKVKVNNARVAMVKNSDLSYADIGTTITYTIAVNNSGNVSATNVLISDTIPAGTDFVNGSFSVNGTTIPGSPNPPGLNIGTIPVGVTTVSFKVTVNTIPTPNPIQNSATTTFNYTVDPSVPNGGAGNGNSNTAYTQVNHVQLMLNKLVDKKYATCSDKLKYTVAISNIGNVSAENIFFKDTLPNGTQFISDSFTVNGVTIVGANPSTGVNIATIPGGATSTLTFQVSVIC